MMIHQLISVALAFTLAPFMLGVINRTKSFFAGRVGQPLLQVYFDLFKLVRKGAVYSRTTTWVFRAGPVVGLAGVLSVFMLLPFGRYPALIQFHGDFILLAYLLGLARFFTVLAALDTGSSFEGMGASREVTFSALAEPVLFLSFFALAREMKGFSLSDIFVNYPESWVQAGPVLMLVAISFFVVLLAENARVPVDDPNTHLELTMIHEAMVLDHSGPDLAFILYGSSLKLWIFGSFFLGVLLPVQSGSVWINQVIFVFGMTALMVGIGVVESIMARLRLNRIPPLLIGAGACSLFALLLVLKEKP